MSGPLDRNAFDPGFVDAYLTRVETWTERDVIPTPWDTMNRQLRGFGGGMGLYPGWYCVMGGSTGAGKSLWALNMAKAALLHRWPVGFVTLEMSPEQLSLRLYAMLFGMDVGKLSPGKWYDPREAERLKDAVNKGLDQWPAAAFWMNQDRLRDVSHVIDLMHGWREQGARMQVLDYVQLCRAGTEVETHKRIQAISEAVCDFAHDTGTLVIALSQFHSQARRNRDQSPTVDSLYGGVDLGNDADLVCLLDHSRYERTEDHLARTFMGLEKNREGPPMDWLPVEWNYRTLTLREAMPDEADRWPEHGGKK